jgi:uncharacterized protein (TIGR02217 family)
MPLNQFPQLAGQGFLSEKTPIWSTQVAESVSGRERRRQVWSYPRWRFQVGYEFLRDTPTKDEIHQLWVYFNTSAGMYAEFGYLDPYDNAAVDMPFGTGNGSTTQFQLSRTTTSGGLSFTEPMFAFVGNPIIYKAGVVQTAYTISNGLVTFTTAPANGAALTWTGQYMFLCRFEEDSISPKQMMSQFWSLDGVAFKSVKKP